MAVSQSPSRGELRPSGMTAIVARSFRLLVRHFLSSFGLGALWSSLPLMLFGFAVSRDRYDVALVAALLLYVAAFYWYAAIMLTVSYELIGERVAWRQIFRQLRGLLTIRLFIASLAILVVGILSIVPVAVLAEWVTNETWFAPPLRRFLAVLLIMLGLMPPLHVWTSSLFALPVVVLEGVGPWRAIGRSWRLVGGYRWEVAATYMLATGLYVGAALLLHTLEQSVAEPSSADIWLGSLSYLAFFPWFIIMSVLLYYDLRVRKEFLNVRTLQHQIT